VHHVRLECRPPEAHDCAEAPLPEHGIGVAGAEEEESVHGVGPFRAGVELHKLLRSRDVSQLEEGDGA
jgi:hypothetical protein